MFIRIFLIYFFILLGQTLVAGDESGFIPHYLPGCLRVFVNTCDLTVCGQLETDGPAKTISNGIEQIAEETKAGLTSTPEEGEYQKSTARNQKNISDDDFFHTIFQTVIRGRHESLDINRVREVLLAFRSKVTFLQVGTLAKWANRFPEHPLREVIVDIAVTRSFDLYSVPRLHERAFLDFATFVGSFSLEDWLRSFNSMQFSSEGKATQAYLFETILMLKPDLAAILLEKIAFQIAAKGSNSKAYVGVVKGRFLDFISRFYSSAAAYHPHMISLFIPLIYCLREEICSEDFFRENLLKYSKFSSGVLTVKQFDFYFYARSLVLQLTQFDFEEFKGSRVPDSDENYERNKMDVLGQLAQAKVVLDHAKEGLPNKVLSPKHPAAIKYGKLSERLGMLVGSQWVKLNAYWAVDVSKVKGLGYDFLVFDPVSGHCLRVEVKSRLNSTNHVFLTRNEVTVSDRFFKMNNTSDSYLTLVVSYSSSRESLGVRSVLAVKSPNVSKLLRLPTTAAFQRFSISAFKKIGEVKEVTGVY